MKPMMSDNEIKMIEHILSQYDGSDCLEWGSGYSTTYFPTKARVNSWLAVEHNGNWIKKIKDKCPDNVQIIWILEGTSYADCVQLSNRKFDFILIDGLDREKCLENARNILKPGGVILLHDAGRSEYWEFIQKHDGEIISEGEIPEGDGYAHRGLARFYGTS